MEEVPQYCLGMMYHNVPVSKIVQHRCFLTNDSFLEVPPTTVQLQLRIAALLRNVPVQARVGHAGVTCTTRPSNQDVGWVGAGGVNKR